MGSLFVWLRACGCQKSSAPSHEQIYTLDPWFCIVPMDMQLHLAPWVGTLGNCLLSIWKATGDNTCWWQFRQLTSGSILELFNTFYLVLHRQCGLRWPWTYPHTFCATAKLLLALLSLHQASSTWASQQASSYVYFFWYILYLRT